MSLHEFTVPLLVLFLTSPGCFLLLLGQAQPAASVCLDHSTECSERARQGLCVDETHLGQFTRRDCDETCGHCRCEDRTVPNVTCAELTSSPGNCQVPSIEKYCRQSCCKDDQTGLSRPCEYYASLRFCRLMTFKLQCRRSCRTCLRGDDVVLSSNTTCAEYAAQGMCDHPIIQTYCKISCNVCHKDCKDGFVPGFRKDETCQKLAKWGYCEHEFMVNLMKLNCKESCRSCSKPGDCLDKRRNCAEQASVGLCTDRSDVGPSLLTKCVKSCNLCDCEDREVPHVTCKTIKDVAGCTRDIEKYCPISCCSNQNDVLKRPCPFLRRINQCQVEEVQKYCRKSCDRCHIGVDVELHPNVTCTEYVAKGMCDHPVIKTYCKKSCGYCKLACEDGEIPGYEDYNCDYLASWNYCKRGFLVASTRIHCPKSCNVCQELEKQRGLA